MDILALHDSLFDDLLEEVRPVTGLDDVETQGRQPGREPVYSVETLLEGRTAWEAVLEDARPFVRR